MPAEKTILIIDDDRNLRETLALILRRAGYCVVSADDVERAFLPLYNHGCDLVIFDLNDPEGTLVGAVTQIRSSHPGAPIVVLTGILQLDLLKLSQEKKVLGYLEKPIDPIKILNYVAGVMHSS